MPLPTEISTTPTPVPSDLDAPCSRHLRWRQLVQCGQTWARLATTPAACANLPLQPATWQGLQQLAAAILDPLIDRFGPVELTYAFAGPSLLRHIAGRIAPALDQHAGSELNRAGRLVCSRGGQACDLLVPGVPATAVAQFIASQLPFDRLYWYGDDRPLHVSHGPQHSRAMWAMVALPDGRRVPRRLKLPSIVRGATADPA